MRENSFESLGGKGLESPFPDGFPGRVSTLGGAGEGLSGPEVVSGGAWLALIAGL